MGIARLRVQAKIKNSPSAIARAPNAVTNDEVGFNGALDPSAREVDDSDSGAAERGGSSLDGCGAGAAPLVGDVGRVAPFRSILVVWEPGGCASAAQTLIAHSRQQTNVSFMIEGILADLLFLKFSGPVFRLRYGLLLSRVSLFAKDE